MLKMAWKNAPASSIQVTKPSRRRRPSIAACFPNSSPQLPQSETEQQFSTRTRDACSTSAVGEGIGGCAGRPDTERDRFFVGRDHGLESSDGVCSDGLCRQLPPSTSSVESVNSIPSSAFKSPAFFTVLQKYLPFTGRRLAQSRQSMASSVESVQDWLNEPDDTAHDSSTIKKAPLEASPTSSKTVDLPQDKTADQTVRPMDVEALLKERRKFSNDSQSSCDLSTTCDGAAVGLGSDAVSSPKKHVRYRSTSAEVEHVRKKLTEGGKRAKSAKQPSPNAFVSLRILSPSIRGGLETVQKAMVERDKTVQPALTSLDKLHITLSVIRLENIEEQERAKTALLEAAMKLNSDLGLYNHPLTLTISGLSSFNGRVVFAEVSDQTRLLKVSEAVRAVFEEHGFPDVSGQEFSPHLTIAKLSLAQRRGGRGDRRRERGFDEGLYADFKDTEFGEEQVKGIELLSMTYPPAEDHYYHCFQLYSFKELEQLLDN